MTNYKLFPTVLLVFGVCISATSCRIEKKTKGTADNNIVVASSSAAIVQTTAGKVAGYVDKGIFIFKGIPYAKAERFMPPTDPTPWEGIRSSRAYGPTSPQEVRSGWQVDQMAFAFNWDDGYPGEDCQRVNIWTPSITNGKNLPVMVWLHGGGYSAGSGNELPSYDGINLASKGDIVMVSVNHRLNILGFLDLSAYGKKYENSGNVGFLDLIAALRWINANISKFGGDPGNVTIFGQSGGGSKVSNLLAAPAAKGLFHKAIVQSGSAIRISEKSYTTALGVAVMEELGLKSSEIDKINDIPYSELLAAGNAATKKLQDKALADGEKPLISSWGPVVDGINLPHHPFYPNAPEQSRNIPMLIGTTLHEFMTSGYIPGAQQMSENQIKEILQNQLGDNTDKYVSIFKKVYPSSKPIDLLDVDTRFRSMAVQQANVKYAQKGAEVYMYLFTWESPVMDGMLRSMHCMELPFVFNNICRCASMTGGGKDAYALAEKMSSSWINFAKTGDPNAEGLPNWEPYTSDKGATMIFGNECSIKYNHDKALLNLINN